MWVYAESIAPVLSVSLRSFMAKSIIHFFLWFKRLRKAKYD